MNEFGLALQDAQMRTDLRFHGADYILTKKLSSTNDFGELIEGEPIEIRLRGLFHTERSPIQINVGEGGAVKVKDNPMILCAYADGAKVTKGFEVTIGQTLYRVKALTDIGQMHKWLNISLEAVENGSERF